MRLKLLFTGLVAATLSATAAEPAKARPTKTFSLEELVSTAIQKNLDIQIQRIGPENARLILEGSYSAYDPLFAVGVRQNYSSSPPRVNAALATSEVATETYTESYGGLSGDIISGKAISGLRYGVTASMQRNSGSGFKSFEYPSSIGMDLSQPLLRNFLIDADRTTILINKKNVKESELSLRQQVMNTVAQVEQAYFDLISARESVKVQEKALELAQRLLAENSKRVQVGAMAPLDEKSAESQVAASKADLLTAQRTLSAQENALKGLITDDYAGMKDLEIIPATGLVAVPERFDLAESWQRGLSLRPDLLNQRIEIEKRDANIRYQKNQLLPQFDVSGTYGYSAVGRTVGASLREIREQSNPRYSVGANFSIPLGNQLARSNYKLNKSEKQQDLLRLKKLEQDIMIQIADAVKLAQTSLERVEATRQSRVYAEAALDAEQKKLENGKSTSYQVLQFQRDLTQRRSDEIRALADYNKSLTQLSLDEANILERNRIRLDTK